MAFLRYLILSCSGFRSYAAFLRLPARSAVLYWCGCSGIVAAALAFNAWRWFGEEYPRLLDDHLAEIPAFTLSGGVAKLDGATPIYGNTNLFPIVLDARGDVKELSKRFPSGALVTGGELSVWFPGSRPVTSSWKHWPDGRMDRGYLDELGRSARESCLVLMPFAWAMVAAIGLLQALGFASLGAFFERSMEPSLDFIHLFNLATFALTPGTLILTVYSVVGFHEVSYPLVYFGCYGLFLIMASAACREALSGPPPVEDEDDQ